MWEAVVFSCWIGTIFALIIAEWRHSGIEAIGKFGAPVLLVASLLGIGLSGWFVIAIFCMAAGVAAAPQSAARKEEIARNKREMAIELDPATRAEELNAIEEDQRQG